MNVKAVDHICFAVRSVDQARKFYEEVLGMKPACEYVSDEESIRVIRYYVGEVAVEIMEPTKPDCEVGRFLENWGEGFFLISYRVDDAQAALEALRNEGHATIDEKPRSLMGNRYAFIQPPRETHGVLIEIIDGEFENPAVCKRETSD